MKKKYKYLSKIKLNENLTIRDTLKIFNKFSPFTDGKGYGLIVNGSSQCIGVLTDGDVRRSLLKDGNLKKKIKNIKKKKFYSLTEDYKELDLINYFEKYSSPIPILNSKNKIIDIIFKKDLISYTEKKIIEYEIRVPLRVSFAGGGFDFTSQIIKTPIKVFSANLKKYIYTKLTTRNDNRINVKNHILNKIYKYESIEEVKKQKNKNDLITQCLINFETKSGFDLEIFSDVETGSGLGSSSIITFSVIKILSIKENKNLSDLEIAQMSYKIERLYSNLKGGWQDQLSVARIGFKLITMDKNNFDIKKINPSKEFLEKLERNGLLIRFANSRTLNEMKKNNSKIFDLQYIRRINDLTMKLVDTFNNEDYRRFTYLLNMIWQIKLDKEKLNSETNTKKLIKKIENLGVDSFKILGAKGSGYILLFADRAKHKKIKNSFKQKHISFENIFFDNELISINKKIII